MENQDGQVKAGWLRELESKSWSLEMTISGAATVAVSFLPPLIECGLDYYMENLAPSENKFAIVFPVLSYSFFMVVAWVLIGTFVLHLCMRALWVGAIGLHSAFPEGIRFDKLPNVSVYYQKMVQQKFGTLEQFIFRLDKNSNGMYALAFILAMGMGGLGLIYLIFFTLMLLLRNTIDPETTTLLGQLFYYGILAVSVMILISNWWLKRHPEKEKLGNLLASIQILFGRITIPFFSRPMMYLTMTFMSNVGRVSYYVSMLLIVLFMVISTLFVTLRKISQWTGRTPSFERAFFSKGSPQHNLNMAAYDALRPEEMALPEVSIASDIVETPYLAVFVKYPHYLDNRLLKMYQNRPEPDGKTITKTELNLRIDSTRIACLTDFFRLQINDTLLPAPEWLFTEKNGSKGLVAYLDTRKFVPGKNFLSVRIPSETKSDSLVMYGGVFFWYGGK